MLSRLLASVTDPSAPPTSAAPTAPSTVPLTEPTGSGRGVGSTIGDVVRTVADNLGHSGYQTGVALVVATVAVVAMLNIAVHRLVLVPVAIGAFWAGWLGWNTFTGQDNPLFPVDVDAPTKLWDVGLTDDTGFLLVVAVACVAAVFLWRRGTDLFSRVLLIVGAVLGASFVFNLVEALRHA